jgi:hypothetical protein
MVENLRCKVIIKAKKGCYLRMDLKKLPIKGMPQAFVKQLM